MSATHALINFPKINNPKVDMIFVGDQLYQIDSESQNKITKST
jgi:hypothetical protein